MNVAAATSALIALGFYSPEKGSFQLDNGNVNICVDFFDQHAEVSAIVGCQRMGTWDVTTAAGLVKELQTMDANFFGYPGYKSFIAA